MRKVKFYNIELFCSDQTFEPRPQTEFLVESIVKEIGDRKLVIFDVFCGIGNIGIALALNCPNIRVYGTDIAPTAVDLAWRNAVLYGVHDRVTWLRGNTLEPLRHLLADVIVANPPYVPTFSVPWLTRKRYVYDGGLSGLKYFHLTTAAAWNCLKPGGLLVFESGSVKQGKQLEKILLATGESNPEIIPVPARNEVVVITMKPKIRSTENYGI